MPSWPARLAAGYVRLIVRRNEWGDERALARRSRLFFGAPALYQRLMLYGVSVRRVIAGTIHGEWIQPAELRHSDVLLYVHGGGYVSCSAQTHRPITAALARRLGCRVFSADYRTAPESRFPAAFEDVVAV